MDKPLVSVLTITRNRGDLLKRCINSVLSQTYENIEHTVIDGASDDNTDEIVASFSDPRLRFFKLDHNWPLKETMDYGLSLCKGKYLAFLDSDDEYLPTKIEKQVSLIESLSEDYGFVYCWMSFLDSGKNNQVDHIHDTKLRGDVKDEVIGEPLVSGTPTMLFKKDFFERLGGWKSAQEIGIASDWEMCARACQISKVDFVPESLVNVYINHGKIRQSESKKYYNDAYYRHIKFHNYFLTYFSENFKRKPQLAAYHYYGIASNYFLLRNYSMFLIYIIKALGHSPSITFKKLLKK